MRGTRQFPNSIGLKETEGAFGPVVELWVDGLIVTDGEEQAALPRDEAVVLAPGWVGCAISLPYHYRDAGTAVPIATCNCGIYGCGGLSVTVTSEPQHVVWTVCDPWGTPIGTTWRFERQQLCRAIERATGVSVQ